MVLWQPLRTGSEEVHISCMVALDTEGTSDVYHFLERIGKLAQFSWNPIVWREFQHFTVTVWNHCQSHCDLDRGAQLSAHRPVIQTPDTHHGARNSAVGKLWHHSPTTKIPGPMGSPGLCALDLACYPSDRLCATYLTHRPKSWTSQTWKIADHSHAAQILLTEIEC